MTWTIVKKMASKGFQNPVRVMRSIKISIGAQGSKRLPNTTYN